MQCLRTSWVDPPVLFSLRFQIRAVESPDLPGLKTHTHTHENWLTVQTSTDNTIKLTSIDLESGWGLKAVYWTWTRYQIWNIFKLIKPFHVIYWKKKNILKPLNSSTLAWVANIFAVYAVPLKLQDHARDHLYFSPFSVNFERGAPCLQDRTMHKPSGLLTSAR